MIFRFARSEVTINSERSLTIAGYGVTYGRSSAGCCNCNSFVLRTAAFERVYATRALAASDRDRPRRALQTNSKPPRVLLVGIANTARPAGIF